MKSSKRVTRGNRPTAAGNRRSGRRIQKSHQPSKSKQLVPVKQSANRAGGKPKSKALALRLPKPWLASVVTPLLPAAMEKEISKSSSTALVVKPDATLSDSQLNAYIADLRSVLDPGREHIAYETIKASIATMGQSEPIKMRGKVVLDGYKRMDACRALGIEPKTVQVAPGIDPIEVAFDLNFCRGHWTQNEKVLWIDKACQLRPGQNARIGTRTIGELCAELDTSGDNVSRYRKAKAIARELGEDAAQELDTRFKHGESPRQLMLEFTERQDAIQNADAIAKTDAATTDAVGRLRAMAKSKARFHFIYADPPWKEAVAQRTTPYERYLMPTYMREGDPVLDANGRYTSICAMADDIKAIAAKDAVLWLWTTSSLLPNGLEVMRAWGFKYTTAIIWKKVNGMRSKGAIVPRHEFLLIGRMTDKAGRCEGAEQDIVLIGNRGEGLGTPRKHYESVLALPDWTRVHSEKPEAVAQIADDLYPKAAKIELFARKPRKGWTVWGNEDDGKALAKLHAKAHARHGRPPEREPKHADPHRKSAATKTANHHRKAPHAAGRPKSRKHGKPSSNDEGHARGGDDGTTFGDLFCGMGGFHQALTTLDP